MKILVAYDGTLNSKAALKYGIRKAKEDSGELIVLHVFNSNIFIGYDSNPNAESLARKESAVFVEEARRILEEAGAGLMSRIILEEGDPREEILGYAESEKVDMILSPPSFRSIAKKARCPVAFIPGYLLLPLDNATVPNSMLERIIEEAKTAGSKVILLGIVPVHMYNRWEKEELREVEKQTSAAMKRVKDFLSKQKVETKEIICRGYPDEEIMKVADEYPVSMVIMTVGGVEPSEVSKAAAILLERQHGNKPLVPIQVMP